jgi:hypothetical protein
VIVFNSQADLITGVCNWLNRRDTETQARVLQCIGLAESEMKRRLRNDVQRAAIDIAALVIDVPAAAQDVRTLVINTGQSSIDGPIDPRSADDLYRLRRLRDGSGRPKYFARVGDELLFDITPDQTYTGEIVYIAAFVPLSSSAALLQSDPDLYLYGTLLQMAPYLEHDERVPLWAAGFDKAIDQINAQRENKEAELQVQSVRLPRVFG